LPALVFFGALAFAGYHWHVLRQIKPETGLSPPSAWQRTEQAIVLAIYALPGLALAISRAWDGSLPIESQLLALVVLALAPVIHHLFDQRIFEPIEERLAQERAGASEGIPSATAFYGIDRTRLLHRRFMRRLHANPLAASLV